MYCTYPNLPGIYGMYCTYLGTYLVYIVCTVDTLVPTWYICKVLYISLYLPGIYGVYCTFTY